MIPEVHFAGAAPEGCRDGNSAIVPWTFWTSARAATRPPSARRSRRRTWRSLWTPSARGPVRLPGGQHVRGHAAAERLVRRLGDVFPRKAHRAPARFGGGREPLQIRASAYAKRPRRGSSRSTPATPFACPRCMGTCGVVILGQWEASRPCSTPRRTTGTTHSRVWHVVVRGLLGGVLRRPCAAFPKTEARFEERRLLYRLYHYLNHYNLFGGGYKSQCVSIMNALLEA